MNNKLPECFAFKNTGKHPRKDEIKEMFNGMSGKYFSFNSNGVYYGRKNNGVLDWFDNAGDFGSTVTEITEDQFLEMTEPELTKLPENFYFKYVDEKDRELLKERFPTAQFPSTSIGDYYGIQNGRGIYKITRNYLPDDSTEITQQDFIRLTEPGIVVDAPTPLTGQIIEISERGILISLTEEQIKSFNIFEEVTITR